MKEKPLIVTFCHLIEDHVNQDVSPTPASSVAAESERDDEVEEEGGERGGEGGRSLRWQSEALISECFLLHRNKLLIYIYWEGERGVYLNPGKEALPWCAAELILHINLQSWGRDGWVDRSSCSIFMI